MNFECKDKQFANNKQAICELFLNKYKNFANYG